MLKYKGYSGNVIYDDVSKIFHGEILDTKDVITFQGRTVDEIEQAFRDSIDDYLQFCAERNEKPDKPFSGKFVLRMTPHLHHQIHVRAARAGKSINKWVIEKITESN